MTDDEVEAASVDGAVLPPLAFLDEKTKAKVKWEEPPMQEQQQVETPSPRLQSHDKILAMYQKKSSLSEFHSSSPALVTDIDNDPNAANVAPCEPTSPRMIRQKSFVPGQRRATVGVNEVSHHALERLGVDADMLKKEKGMKKLGISDVDIERSEELRRYTGIATKSTSKSRNKAELVFGFTGEQLQRDKAMKRLGTTEQEIFDDYCRRVSRLGIHERPMTSF